MTTIDLQDVPVIWITHIEAVERHKSMLELFDKLGIKNHRMISGDSLEKVGKTERQIQQEKSHLVAQAHAEALEVSGPVLVLEDDCALTNYFVDTKIDFPCQADALYLGSSHYGMVNGVSRGKGVIFDIYDENWDRIYNMLGIHAVLYLSESYKKKTIFNLLNAKYQNRICDQTIAMDMKNNQIYSLAKPIFFQNVSVNKEVTGVPLRTVFKNQIDVNQYRNSLTSPTSDQVSITAIILNWKRPENVQIILSYLLKYDFISEVIVWNNSPEEFISDANSTKIRVINSEENLRDKAKYLAASEAKNDFVFYQDDDWDCQHYIEALFAAFCLNRDRIHIAVGELTWITHKIDSRKCINPQLNLQAEFAYIGTGSIFPKQAAVTHLSYIDKYFSDDEAAYADVAFTLFMNQPFFEIQVNLSKGDLSAKDEVAFSAQASFDSEIEKVKKIARASVIQMEAIKQPLPDLSIKSIFRKLMLFTNFFHQVQDTDLIVFDPQKQEHLEPNSLSFHRVMTHMDIVKTFRDNPYSFALTGIHKRRPAEKGWLTQLKSGDLFVIRVLEPSQLSINISYNQQDENKIIQVRHLNSVQSYTLKQLNGARFNVDFEVSFISIDNIDQLSIIFYEHKN